MAGYVKTDRAELSPTQQSAVIEETKRLVAHPTFKSSKRCVTLLSYLIDRALAGNRDDTKERTLGIEVFERDPDFDTSADPIVRMAANEIRKRLAQYYLEADCHHTVTISLPRGAYILEFEFGQSDQLVDGCESNVPNDPPRPLISRRIRSTSVEGVRRLALIISRYKWILGIAATLIVLAAFLAHDSFSILRSTQDLVWKPLLDSREPLTVCVADDYSLQKVNDQNLTEDQMQTMAKIIASREVPQISTASGSSPTTPFVDANVAQKISGWLVEHGRHAILRPSSTITLQDFRRGPAVLVGAFDNPWSLILLSNVRYSVRIDPTTHNTWIQDARNPSKRDWQLNTKLGIGGSFVDYAVITRFLGTETGEWIMAVGGLGSQGTEAACELITDSSFARSLPASLRSAKGNFQIVVKTDVINGHAGPPQIVAIHTW